MHRLPRPVAFLVDLTRETITRYGRIGGSQFAAAISYRALFSLIPLATFVSTVFASVLAGNEKAQSELVAAIEEHLQLTPGGADSLDTAITAIPSPWSVVGVVSLGLALWGATGVMSSVQKAVAFVFDGGEGRNFVRGRLVSALLVLGVLGLLLAAVALSLLEGIAKRISEDVGDALDVEPLELGLVFGVLAPLALTLAVAVLLIRLLPHTKPSWQAALLGGGAVAIGFQAIQRGLSWYLSGPADYRELYGSASAVFAFLFSVYLSASAFVVGAVLAAVLDEHVRPDEPVTGD